MSELSLDRFLRRVDQIETALNLDHALTLAENRREVAAIGALEHRWLEADQQVWRTRQFLWLALIAAHKRSDIAEQRLAAAVKRVVVIAARFDKPGASAYPGNVGRALTSTLARASRYLDQHSTLR